MNLATLAARNLTRNRFRTLATVSGVAIALIAFVLLRTVVTAWYVAADYAAQDRIATRHKVTFTMQLPKRYIDVVRNFDGVDAATWANWFGGRDPREPDNFFATLAVDPESFLGVYPELVLDGNERSTWLGDRRGVILGDVLAQRLHARVGERVRIEGSIYPGTWEFNVSGIYTATRKSIDRSQFLFHWDYLNESVRPSQRDQIGWIIARVNDTSRAASITQALDRRFETEEIQTISMSERALNMSFMAMFDSILAAFDIVAALIMLILMLLLGNTIAMGVRERTSEYGAMRAIGFLPAHIRGLVLGEGLVLGLFAGVVGCALAYPIVELGLGRWLEENMGGMFPYFRIEPRTLALSLGLSCLLGIAASLIPALAAAKLNVTDALRRTE